MLFKETKRKQNDSSKRECLKKNNEPKNGVVILY